jgi:hypothetical protein
MTLGDWVRKYFPDATDKQVMFILWEKTPFPMCSAETTEKYLKAYKEEIKGKKVNI